MVITLETQKCCKKARRCVEFNFLNESQQNKNGKRQDHSLETTSILVIFGRSLFERSLKNVEMIPHISACSVVISLGLKNVEKGTLIRRI